MNLLYDHQTFTTQRFGGISRYYCEMFRNFPADVKFNQTAYFSDNEYLKEYTSKVISILPDKKIRGRRRFYEYFNKMNSIRYLKNQNFDIFHPTYYDPYYIEHVGNKPIVLSLHDMIHELYPEYFEPEDMTSAHKLKSVERADVIVAVSHQSRNDLIRVLNVNPSRVIVINQGTSLDDDFIIPPARAIEKPYILFVGERGLYKNFPKFFEVFTILKQTYPDLQLICTGKSFTKEEINLFVSAKMQDDVKYIWASDAQMAQLFRDAELFVFPSLCEGFGLPILEAYKYGCATAVSSLECFREIADDASLYFDSYDTDSILDALTRILSDNELKQSLIKKGAERVKLFTWKKTTEKALELYRRLL